MNLRLTKELKPKTSERLLLLNKNLSYLKSLNDGLYLQDAFSQKIPVWKVPTIYEEELLTLKIGPFDSRRKFNLRKRCESNLFYFDKEVETNKKITFGMTLLANNYPRPCTSLLVYTDSAAYNSRDFTMDPVLGRKSGNLLALAAFFYKRFFAYQKIHDFLSEKSSLLETQISKEYIEALVELFSIEKEMVAKKGYDIPSSFSKKGEYPNYLPTIEKDAFFSVGFKYFLENMHQNLEILVSLNEAGELVYDIIPIYNSIVNLEDGQVIDFINKNTSYCLEEVEEAVNFGLKIAAIPSLKRKILISNV